MLKLEEEYTLAKSWKENKDINAAHKLVTSHLRLVAKIALKYRGYGLPIPDLISEGNILNYDYITDSFSLSFSKSTRLN